MKKITTLFSVLLCTVAMQAQTVNLKMAYSPNTIYTNSTEQNTKIEISYGDEPMVQESGSKMTSTVTTGAATAGEIPFSMVIAVEPGTQGAEQMDGAKFIGKISKDGAMSIQTVESEKMLPQMKDMMKGMMESTLSKNLLPIKTLKVGESFTEETPIEMPMSGFTMKLKDVATYKLEKVEGRKAHFTQNHIVTLDMDVEGQNMKGTGTGTGTLVYDLDKNFTLENNTNMKMEMGFEAQGMQVNLKTDTIAKVTTVIAPAK